MNSISENVNIRNKKLDGSERSETLGVTLTTYIGKKKASISSTNLSEKNLIELVTRCIDSTKVTPEDEYNSLPDLELHFKGEKNLELYDNTHLSNDEKINFIKEAEEVAFSHDKIVNTVQKFYCSDIYILFTSVVEDVYFRKDHVVEIIVIVNNIGIHNMICSNTL